MLFMMRTQIHYSLWPRQRLPNGVMAKTFASSDSGILARSKHKHAWCEVGAGAALHRAPQHNRLSIQSTLQGSLDGLALGGVRAQMRAQAKANETEVH